MATWNSKHKVKWDEDQGMSYSANENSWSYGTVSDVLTVTTKVGEFSDFEYYPPSERVEHYSRTEALALLETLMDWAKTYEGSKTVDDIIRRVNEE